MAGFRVKRAMCETCIFRPHNPMHLRAGRLRELVRDAEAADTHIICHDTLESVTGTDETEAACRGYLDAGHAPQMVRIAERLNMIEVVD